MTSVWSKRPTNQSITHRSLRNAIAEVNIHEAIEASPENHGARRLVALARHVSTEPGDDEQVM